MEDPKRNQEQEPLPCEGRDELNLAEFPIAVLSSRVGNGVKTIYFEDRIWDKRRGDWVPRRLTISASDRYGLPTALDDEVVLGLIQLTRENDFEHREVFFSRYRLLRLLGWRNEGKSYTRLETSLKRWLGVTFYYDNAWWDRASQAWVAESFHLLEHLSLLDSAQRAGGKTRGELPLSMFVWNEAVFRSFKAGYLKQIDMQLFRQLRSPITKRLYRLLDKRFYHKTRWAFDLRELACEHVGLSRSYDTGQLKRKLKPAIRELESAGFLQPIPDAVRFGRIGDGKWQVEFTRGKGGKAAPEGRKGQNRLKDRLLQKGVRPGTADELISRHTAREIEERIDALDWMLRQGGHRVKSVAGYLVQSIRDGYEFPAGFSPTKCATSRSPARPEHKLVSSHRSQPAEGNVEQRKVRAQRYLDTLSPAERQRVENEALSQADSILGPAYRRMESHGMTAMAEVYRKVILERHVATVLRSFEETKDCLAE